MFTEQVEFTNVVPTRRKVGQTNILLLFNIHCFSVFTLYNPLPTLQRVKISHIKFKGHKFDRFPNWNSQRASMSWNHSSLHASPSSSRNEYALILSHNMSWCQELRPLSFPQQLLPELQPTYGAGLPLCKRRP